MQTVQNSIAGKHLVSVGAGCWAFAQRMQSACRGVLDFLARLNWVIHVKSGCFTVDGELGSIVWRLIWHRIWPAQTDLLILFDTRDSWFGVVPVGIDLARWNSSSHLVIAVVFVRVSGHAFSLSPRGWCSLRCNAIALVDPGKVPHPRRDQRQQAPTPGVQSRF